MNHSSYVGTHPRDWDERQRNAWLYDTWREGNQQNSFCRPPSWEEMERSYDIVRLDDPEFPFPNREQWEQCDRRLQKCLWMMLNDLWMLGTDTKEWAYVRTMFAGRFS